MQMYAIDLRQAPFIGWIKDLSQADPYYITPVLLGLLMLVQMRMMPSASADPMQKNIMMIMPLVFTFAMISLPAGLVVYMIANTAITVGQQRYIQSKLTAAGA
jgi:YidC/Oxa1 family membrane protein insertase